jgi:hypothetical protein
LFGSSGRAFWMPGTIKPGTIKPGTIKKAIQPRLDRWLDRRLDRCSNRRWPR